ncbi:MAG: hypothetical protein KAX49_06455 [Halanaerobiales bacterium]|nr:hypothetical protein [Halanaerobiales bacterium]
MARNIAKKPELKIITTLHGTNITLVGNDPSFKELTKYSIEEPDDYVKMAEKGIYLLQNPSIHQEFAERGRKVVEKRFDAEKIISQYENFYQSL